MNRTASLALLLCLVGASPLLAQDSKPVGTPAAKEKKLDPRFVLDSTASLDKKAVKPNGLQYFLWERLNHYRFRIDSKQKIGHKKLDAYVAKLDRYWKKQDPENGQKVDFTLTVKQATTYNASKFYGEAQAHNYKGGITAELKDAEGKVVETFTFELSWGRLISSGLSKRQVQLRYDQMVHTALALRLLNHPTIRGKISPKYYPDLKKWSKKQKADLLKVLEGSTKALKEGKMAEFVRNTKIDWK